MSIKYNASSKASSIVYPQRPRRTPASYVIPTMPRSVAAERGFTLLEVMVLVSVLILIVIAIVSATRFVYRGQRFAFEQADATRSARIGIERAVRDLREAAYADDGAYPIFAMSTSTITFYSDFDNDQSIERVRYFLDGTDFKKGVVEASGDPPAYVSSEVISIVSDNTRNAEINTPLFTFYDKVGVLLTDYTEVDDLAFVVVRMVVNLHPERAPDDFELRSSATLRNVK